MNSGRIRVLRLTTRLPPYLGGQEIHVLELTRALSRLGVDQMLVYQYGSVGGLLPSNVDVAERSVGRLAVADLAMVSRRARDFRPDVVHSHGSPWVCAQGWALAVATRSRHVHTYHATFPTSRRHRILLRSTSFSRTTFIVVATTIEDQLRSAGVPPDHIFVVPSGVRDAFLGPNSISPSERTGVVMGGRLIPAKGVLRLARHWPTVEGTPNLVTFGTGPEAQLLSELAEGHPMVTFVGSLDEDRLSALLFRSRVGVVRGLPNTADASGEGTPTIGLEMLASDLSLVISGTTGDLHDLAEALSTPIARVESNTSEPELLRRILELHAQYPFAHKTRSRRPESLGWLARAKEIMRVYGSGSFPS